MENKVNDRNTGIEMLRIVAMAAIMILHVLTQGGVLYNLERGTASYAVGWLLEMLCLFGVNAYGLISGYVCYGRKFRFSNILYTWLQVVFFTVIITGAFFIVWPNCVDKYSVIGAVFPIMTEQYWYFTAYAVVFLLSPFINAGMEKADNKLLGALTVILLTLFCVLATLFENDVFALRKGYGALWLLTLYIVGAYVKKTDAFSKVKKPVWLIVFFLGVFVTFSFKLITESFAFFQREDMLAEYNSPTVFISAFALLMFFKGMTFKEKSERIIKRVAPLCFGVYLLNTNPLIWLNILDQRYANLASYALWKMLLCVILTALINFFAGIAIDGLRFILFEVTDLRAKLRRIMKEN